MLKYAAWIGMVLSWSTLASAQISVDEAQRRLQSKLAKPATTQPVSEVDRLRAENRRLKEENLALNSEVAQLREALATAPAGAGATTAPTTRASTTAAADDPASRLVGHWEGGDLAAGNAFTLDLANDGTYRQAWLSARHQEAGHWNLTADGIIEMWTNQTGDSGNRNRWRTTFDKTAQSLTLTPTDAGGTDIAAARPFRLRRTR